MQKNNIFTYNQCPICKSDELSFCFTVKDYTVSNEKFDIYNCTNCSFKFTQNIPTQNQISKYYQSEDYISHSNTQKGLVNKLYHFARNYMLKSKRKTVEKHCAKGKLLDVGCGTGYFLNTMKKADWQIIGLEVDEGAKQVCQQNFGISPLPIEALNDFEANSFDAITLWHVLEHVHDLNGYIKTLKEILTAKGRLFIAVPNPESYDANHYYVHWAAWDVPRHLYHFAPKNMSDLLLKHGLTIEKKYLMPFDPFYISLLSEKYTGGKLQFVKGIFQGCISLFKAFLNVNKASSIIYVVTKV